MDESTKKRPINLRKKPRLIIIPASDKPTKILFTPDSNKTRVWVDVPVATTFEHVEETIDKSA